MTDPFMLQFPQKKDKVPLIVYNLDTVCSFSKALDNTVIYSNISGLNQVN